MKKIAHFPSILFVLSLLVPTHGFGQPTLGPVSDTFPAFDPSFDTSLAPPPASAEQIPASAVPTASDVSAAAVPFGVSTTPSEVPFTQPNPPALIASPPVPIEASTDPQTASQFPSMLSNAPQVAQPLLQQQSVQIQNPQREIAVVNNEHPFRLYWGVPNDPQTKIVGKPMSIAELFSGTRSSAVRCQLLQAYWELSGLLAIYHFRCESERLASGAMGQQQESMMTLLREQRRTAEVEFIKQQWVLAELLKQYKGYMIRDSELPIPADFPLYPKYQTHADLIARTKRTQYLGRMIPIQEQLIESKNGTWKAASEMTQNASQPFFMVSNQRTTAFLDLTKAITDYNKMIAEYALETIPPNVSQHQLIRAVVRLPQRGVDPLQPQTLQMATATDEMRLTQYDAPPSISAQAVQQVGYEYQPPPLPMPPYEDATEKSESVSDTTGLLQDLL